MCEDDLELIHMPGSWHMLACSLVVVPGSKVMLIEVIVLVTAIINIAVILNEMWLGLHSRLNCKFLKKQIQLSYFEPSNVYKYVCLYFILSK